MLCKFCISCVDNCHCPRCPRNPTRYKCPCGKDTCVKKCIESILTDHFNFTTIQFCQECVESSNNVSLTYQYDMYCDKHEIIHKRRHRNECNMDNFEIDLC